MKSVSFGLSVRIVTEREFDWREGQALKDLSSVQERVVTWQAQREVYPVTIHWHFTAQDARIKLKRLYPSLEDAAPVEKSAE